MSKDKYEYIKIVRQRKLTHDKEEKHIGQRKINLSMQTAVDKQHCIILSLYSKGFS